MTVVYALAAALAAAGAASAQVVARIPSSAPPVSPPALAAPLLAAPSVSGPALLPSSGGPRVLGVPGPGVTPAHVEAAKLLAERTGEAWVLHGSRQTGVSFHTGEPFSPGTDLDLGMVGSPEKLLSEQSEMWDGVPDVRHAPTISVATIEDAVGRGHLVVAPAERRLPGDLGVLRERARPWRTERQLTKLNAAPRAPGEAFRFSVIGDAEPGRFWFSRRLFNQPGVFWKLLARADASRSDFIFQMGDMVSRGTVANFAAFVRGLFSARVKTPYLTALGNHDRHKPHGITHDRVYRAAIGSPDYSFTRGGWRFVVVDSSAGRVTRDQLEWLRAELSRGGPVVVFTHMPPAPLSEWTDWGRLKGAGGFKDGAREFMDLMSGHRVSRVYMGHIHALGTLTRDGVTYVLTGGGGSPLYPGPVKRRLHHWLSVEAGPEGLTETVHAADGSSFPLR